MTPCSYNQLFLETTAEVEERHSYVFACCAHCAHAHDSLHYKFLSCCSLLQCYWLWERPQFSELPFGMWWLWVQLATNANANPAGMRRQVEANRTIHTWRASTAMHSYSMALFQIFSNASIHIIRSCILETFLAYQSVALWLCVHVGRRPPFLSRPAGKLLIILHVDHCNPLVIPTHSF